MAPGSHAAALLLTGGLGAGKTATAVAIGEALERKGVPGAVVDLDWLCWAWGPALGDDGVHRLLCANLASVVPNLVEAGVQRIVLARALLQSTDAEFLRRSLPGIPLTTVLLTVDADEARARLDRRDVGAQLDEHIAQLDEFEARVAVAAADAPRVDTTGRDVTTVAAQVLRLVGWD